MFFTIINDYLQHTRLNAAKEERFAKSTLQKVSTTNISYILYDDDGTKCLLSVQLFVMSSRIYKHILNGVWSEGFSLEGGMKKNEELWFGSCSDAFHIYMNMMWLKILL